MKVHSPFFGLDRTGGTLVLLKYLEALSSEGHAVTITTLGRSHDPRFVDPSFAVSTSYVGLRSRPYRGLIRAIPGNFPFPLIEQHRLARVMPHADLHVVGYSLNLAPVLRSHEPSLYHVQHYEPLIVQGVLARHQARLGYAKAPFVTCNCTWVAERVADAGGKVKAVIPPGFEHRHFRYVPPSGRDRTRVRVLTLGKSVNWKGLQDVEEGVRIFADRRPHLSVELHSYGPDRPRHSLGRASLIHHGFVGPEELASLQSGASVSVTGSWYESFPLPPLEAMAAGTPCITTPIGTEDYARNGENALIVPPRDPSAIADAIDQVIADPKLADSLARAGRETALQFTWERATAAFLEAAKQAL